MLCCDDLPLLLLLLIELYRSLLDLDLQNLILSLDKVVLFAECVAFRNQRLVLVELCALCIKEQGEPKNAGG